MSKPLPDLIATTRTRIPAATLLAARNYFVEGKGNLPQTAAKFGISYDTVTYYSKRERWSERKEAFLRHQAAQAGAQASAQAQAATLEGSPAMAQVRRCDAALQACTDPAEARAWLDVRRRALDQAWLEIHGHYPAQGSTPRPPDPDQGKARGAGRRDVSPIPDPDQDALGNGRQR